jgi:carbamoyl-phosphate synthase large subunit
MSEKVRVLITAVGGAGGGEQILKALRMADGDRYNITVTDSRPNQPQFQLAHNHELLPLANDPSYLQQLMTVCRKHRIDALFPGSEPELKVFAENLHVLREAGLFVPINQPDIIKLCMDKDRTNERLTELGFAPPRGVRIRGDVALPEIDWWPAILKPASGSGGSANCYIVQSAEQLVSLMDYLASQMSHRDFILQEYVGTPDSEFTVGVLHDLDGKLVNSIALRRSLEGLMNVRLRAPNITARTDLGPTLVVSSGISHGKVGKFPELTQQCEAIAEALGSRGPLNIQCRFVEGRVRVFEINPRYSGTTSLRAMAGHNEPDLMIRHHFLGEDIPRNAPVREIEIIRHLAETIVAED